MVVAPATASHVHLSSIVLWVAVALTLVTGAEYLISGRNAATAMER